MGMYVLISYAAFYIWEKFGPKLAYKIGDHIPEYIVSHYMLYPIIECMFSQIKSYLLAWINYYLFAPMWLRLGFLLSYNRNINDLTTQLENLRNKRDEVKGLVNAAERNGEVVLPRVQRWLTSVNKITEDPMNLHDNKLHLNLMLRCQRSKSAEEKTVAVGQLIEKGSSFDRVSTFKSRISISENIMQLLKDDQTNRIGILGVSGVGKTALVKEIYEEIEDGNPFEEVVMATVSSCPDLKTIQNEIADMLGLRFDELSNAGRARRLLKIFEGKKRILIILDDIHGKVELEAIGIPFKERFKGCKIVLVSRSQVACGQSGTEKDFSIRALSEGEGWKLFRRMAGVPLNSRDPLAVEAAKKCLGLPREIVRAASAWKKNSFTQVVV